MSSAVLLIVSSGIRIVSKNYFCVDLSRQARRLTEFKTRCENRNDKVSLIDHEPPSTSQPPEQMPAAATPVPTTEQLSRYPTQALTRDLPITGKKAEVEALFSISQISALIDGWSLLRGA